MSFLLIFAELINSNLILKHLKKTGVYLWSLPAARPSSGHTHLPALSTGLPFPSASPRRNHTLCFVAFVTDKFHCKHVFEIYSFYQVQYHIPFYSQIGFLLVDNTTSIYPFTSWWAPERLSFSAIVDDSMSIFNGVCVQTGFHGSWTETLDGAANFMVTLCIIPREFYTVS